MNYRGIFRCLFFVLIGAVRAKPQYYFGGPYVVQYDPNLGVIQPGFYYNVQPNVGANGKLTKEALGMPPVGPDGLRPPINENGPQQNVTQKPTYPDDHLYSAPIPSSCVASLCGGGYG